MDLSNSFHLRVSMTHNVCITESTNIQSYFPGKIVLLITNELSHFCEAHIKGIISFVNTAPISLTILFIDKTIFPIGKTVFLIGKTIFLIGEIIFLIGKTIFLIGKTIFLIGEIIFLIGETIFLIGKTIFLIGEIIFLIGKTIFPIGNCHFPLIIYADFFEKLLLQKIFLKKMAVKMGQKWSIAINYKSCKNQQQYSDGKTSFLCIQ